MAYGVTVYGAGGDLLAQAQVGVFCLPEWAQMAKLLRLASETRK